MAVGGVLVFTGMMIAATGAGAPLGLAVLATGAAAGWAGYRSYKASQQTAQQGGRASQGSPSQPYPDMAPRQQPYAPYARPSSMAQNGQGQSREERLAQQVREDERLARDIAAAEFRNSVGAGYVPTSDDWQLAQLAQREAASQRRLSTGGGHSPAAGGREQSGQDAQSTRWNRTTAWAAAAEGARSPVAEDKRNSRSDLEAESFFPHRSSSRASSDSSGTDESEWDKNSKLGQGLFNPSNIRDASGAHSVAQPAHRVQSDAGSLFGPDGGTAREGEFAFWRENDASAVGSTRSSSPDLPIMHPDGENNGSGLSTGAAGSEFSARQGPASHDGGEIGRAVTTPGFTRHDLPQLRASGHDASSARAVSPLSDKYSARDLLPDARRTPSPLPKDTASRSGAATPNSGRIGRGRAR